MKEASKGDEKKVLGQPYTAITLLPDLGLIPWKEAELEAK